VWAYSRDGNHGQKPLVVYDFTVGRSGSYARTFLKDFQGYLQTDAYAGYDRLCLPKDQGGGGCIALGCWAHVLRKFEEALIADPSSLASEILVKIRQLYGLCCINRIRVSNYV
jgi:transposase